MYRGKAAGRRGGKMVRESRHKSVIVYANDDVGSFPFLEEVHFSKDVG
jgi:hypothetical protein